MEMKAIQLNQQGKNKGKYVTLVDDEDYEYLNQFRWSTYKDKNTYYARMVIKINGETIRIRMHRLIMKTPKELLTDHKDGNGLNNQKYNLRICNYAQNAVNRKGRGKSDYLGVRVVKRKNKNKFLASICKNYKTILLGVYDNEIEAAKIYDNAAKIYHGEFARLNFKD
jgi:hypothetical protein